MLLLGAAVQVTTDGQSMTAAAPCWATTSAASFVAYPGFPMYVSSKAAGNGLIRAASLDFHDEDLHLTCTNSDGNTLSSAFAKARAAVRVRHSGVRHVRRCTDPQGRPAEDELSEKLSGGLWRCIGYEGLSERGEAPDGPCSGRCGQRCQ